MKRILFFFALTTSAFASEPAPALTPDQLVAIAVSDNPELRFYEQQVAALPKPLQAKAPEVTQPLAFPSREAFRRAVLNLDADLARLYLAEFRFVLASEVRLKAMEYQAATEAAATAGDLAGRISALVKMLEERPAAGVESLIERRILEGAALPFVRQAAESSMRAKLLLTELNGLLGRKTADPLSVTGSFELPGEISMQNPDEPLLLKIRQAEIARGLGGIDAASEVESFALGGWFTREGLGASEAVEGITRPAANFGASIAETRERLADDASRKMKREATQRQAALKAAREVVNAIPPKLIANLQAASDLAERQYRVGALGVNLLIEIHREYLDALEARNNAVIQAWRNGLDLEFLNLPASTKPGGKIIVNPKP